MARKNRPMQSALGVIPKQWRSFPRRPWPISSRRHTKLRHARMVHYDFYLLRHVTVQSRYIVLMLASRHGHNLCGVLTRTIDASTGTMRTAHTLIDATQYKPALASDDVLTARVAKAVGAMVLADLITYMPLPDRVANPYRLPIFHWHNAIRREPNSSEKATPLKLPDIL